MNFNLRAMSSVDPGMANKLTFERLPAPRPERSHGQPNDQGGVEAPAPQKTHAPRRSEDQLHIAPGERDLLGLSSIIREWLVPLLVRDFMAEYEAAMQKTHVNSHEEAKNGPLNKNLAPLHNLIISSANGSSELPKTSRGTETGKKGLRSGKSVANRNKATFETGV